MIHFSKLTPAVYMSARDSGVLFSIRYMINPRQKRGSEQSLWEVILDEFEKHPDIELAYPTTRSTRIRRRARTEKIQLPEPEQIYYCLSPEELSSGFRTATAAASGFMYFLATLTTSSAVTARIFSGNFLYS